MYALDPNSSAGCAELGARSQTPVSQLSWKRTQVLTQLRHTGLLQCCELLKHGYPTRIAYTEVAARYTPILPPQLLALPCLAASDRTLTSALLYGFEVPSDLYQLGATRM